MIQKDISGLLLAELFLTKGITVMRSHLPKAAGRGAYHWGAEGKSQGCFKN